MTPMFRVGMILLLVAGGSAMTAPASGERPLFSFVHLTDTHISYDDKDTYAQAREKLAAAIAQIKSPGRDGFRPDFAIGTGDLAHGDLVEKLHPDNEATAAMLKQLELPMLVTPGNHEVLQGEGNDDLEAPYLRVFGTDTTTYAVRHGGVLFVMVNDSGGMMGGTPVSDRRNQQVAAILAAHPDVPKIIACHIPLVPLRDEKVLEASFGFSTYRLIGAGGLLDVIEQHRDTVIAVISGHLHLTGRVEQNGITHITASGTASYPNHYGEYTVYPDRIEVQMRPIPSRLVVQFASGVHGRKGVMHTDSTHADHDAYVSGRPDEQRFTLPLAGRKVIRPESPAFALNAQGWVAPFTAATRLGPDQVRVTNLSDRERIVRVPFPGGARNGSYVTADGRICLTPAGALNWSAADLRAGIPVVLPAGGAVELNRLDRRPAAEGAHVDTAAALARDRRAIAMLARPAVKLGMRIWSDRPYEVDLLPPELIGIERVTKRVREHALTLTRERPGKAYAVFLPFEQTQPRPEELAALGWTLAFPKGFNGGPYPRSLSAEGFDVYVRELVVGPNRLSEPREERLSTWALIGITED